MRVRWLGRVPYREAWALQRAVSRRSDDDYLLLLEHPPVYTLGAQRRPRARAGRSGHRSGAELVRVDRGGDVTYHGPGQLVGYPRASPWAPDRTTAGRTCSRVEQVVIDALVAPRPARPGTWAGSPATRASGSAWTSDRATAGSAGPRKIAAIGVRTARGRTTHGFALNVTTDLGHVRPHRAVRDRRHDRSPRWPPKG